MRNAMRVLLCFFVCCCAGYAQELPLLGLAHVGIRVSDLDKARAFYGGVLGYDDAFTTHKDDGSVNIVYFKVNDHQFIEVAPGLKPDQNVPMSHIAMYTDDLDKLHQMLTDRGITVTAIHKGPRDGNLSFSIQHPPGQDLVFIEFVEYQPESLHTKSAGKFLSSRRMSTHLEHVGVITTDLDAAYNFYVKQLGFKETWHRANPTTHKMLLVHLRMPGPSKDYVELSVHDQENPLTRERAAMAAHISLEVPDIQAAYKEAQRRSPGVEIKPPRFGLDERWQFNLYDPDGTRVEMMQPRDPAKAGTPVPPVPPFPPIPPVN